MRITERNSENRKFFRVANARRVRTTLQQVSLENKTAL